MISDSQSNAAGSAELPSLGRESSMTENLPAAGQLPLPAVQTLLRQGRSQREIERLTGVDRKTIRRYVQPACEVAAGS
ncbi:MAG: hypothetical protein JWL65_4011 [Gammaproteobacteria bacterium]|nr:hypothetical protein [Gammaproteobacteria bacterium]